MNTEGRAPLFGEVDAGIMRLNPFGLIVENEWRRLGERFGKIKVEEWVVMPNHLHGILVIVEGVSNGEEATNGVGARQESSIQIAKSSFASPQQNKSEFASSIQDSSYQQTIPEIDSPKRSAFGVARGSLGAIVGSFKSSTTRLINGLRRCPGEPVWQRNYYEHIIRNEDEWEAIRNYIHDNPSNWDVELLLVEYHEL